MPDKYSESEHPIRVVMFGGGPVLLPGVQEFICRLEEHPEIEFLGTFCQSQGQGVMNVVKDLWRRRKILAVPLLIMRVSSAIGRFLSEPAKTLRRRRRFSRVRERVHFVPDVHAEVVLWQVRALNPQLGLIYGSPILKPELFDIPALGTLGIHHGKLPEYRGKKTTFWAMSNGEATTGVTIQKVNAGLDTGEIIQQGEVPVKGRSLRVVWKEIESLGFELYIRAIIEIKHGVAIYRPSPGKKGKLYRDPKFSDILRFLQRQASRRLRSWRSDVTIESTKHVNYSKK